MSAFRKEKAVKKNITLGEHFAAALDEICKDGNTTNREVLETVLKASPEFMKVYDRVKIVAIDTDTIYLGVIKDGEK